MSAKTVGKRTMQEVWDFMGNIGKVPNYYDHCWGWKDKQGRVLYDCVLSIKACGWGVDSDITEKNKYDYIAKNKDTMPDVWVGAFYNNAKSKSEDMTKIPKDKFSFVFKKDMSHIGIYNPATGMTREVCAGTVMGYREMALSGYWEAWSNGTPYYTDSSVTVKTQSATKTEPAKTTTATKTETKKDVKKTNVQIASEVIAGKWGNGTDRKNRLEAAGYNSAAVQAEVNKLLMPEDTVPVKAETKPATTTINKVETKKNYQCDYTVVKGDTLWFLAGKFLGSNARWPEIKKLNNLSSTVLRIGQVLKMPNK